MSESGVAGDGASAPDAELESLYRAAFDSAPVAMLLVDDDARYVAVNQAACRLVGRDAAVMIGAPMRNPDGDVRETEPWVRFLADGAVHGEFVYRVADGAERVFEYHAVARVRPKRHLVLLHDVTARAFAERRLIEQEGRFRALLDHSSDAVGIVDPDTTVRYISPAGERILGYPASAILGRTCFATVDPNDVERAKEATRDVFETPGASMTLRTRIVTPEGRVRWIDAAVRNAVDVPEVRGIIANWRDITEQVQTDERARAQEAQIRRLARMEDLARLAGGIAHDFNNLLSVVLSGMELALAQDDPAMAREDFSDALGAGKRAAQLTRQLLAFGRRQVLQPRPTDLGRALDALMPLVQRIVGEDIAVVVQASTPLPPVLIDPTQFEQVVLNLVVNAKDAMATGGRLTMLLAPWAGARPGDGEPGPFVALAVTDTGQGMDAATKARLFEPFFTTKPEGRGTGLGLATVFGVMHQSGGHIAVDSERGRGTTFTLFFRSVEAAGLLRPSAPVPPRPLPRGTETLLVVDDDALVRATALTVLRRSGYDVLEANSAGDALLAAEQYPGEIHAAITDVVMPRMNGRTLVERLRAARPQLKVLYVSGYTDEALRDRGIATDGNDFLPKPFVPSDLLGRVRAVLDADGTRTARDTVPPR